MTAVAPVLPIGRLWNELTGHRAPWSESAAPGLPAICLNMVVSIDGATTVGGRVGPLTSRADQALLRRLRAEADAVLVGAQTVRVEGYGDLLGEEDRRRRTRERGASEPLLCVVTQSLALPANSPALGPSPSPIVFLTSSRGTLPSASRPVAAIRSADGTARSRPLELRPLLRRLQADFGVERIVCEGGPTLNAALFAEDVVQEMFISLSPVLAAQAGSPRLAGGGAPPMPLELVGHAADREFVFLRYRRRR